MTEREWQRTVMELLELHGWMAYHTWSSVHSPAGFPDLIAVRDNRILAIECKTQKGKVTDAQRKWLGALDGVKVIEAFVSRPAPDLSELEQVMS